MTFIRYNKVMFAVGLLQWWYGLGWKRQLATFKSRLAGVYDYFSVDLLVRSWFAPFRQISAGKVQGPLAVQWHAFVDRTISRFIGAFMRTVIILVGIITILLSVILNFVFLAFWLAAPVLPVIGLVLMLAGVQVWNR